VYHILSDLIAFCGRYGKNIPVCFFRFTVYTLSQKVPTFKLSVTLLNLNRFSKFLQCWKAYEILLQNAHNISHLTLGMLLHYLEKLKIQISCRYSADMEENANKLHFTCLVSRSICGTANLLQQMSVQCLSTINMVFRDDNKILIKTHKYAQHTHLHA